MIFKGQDNDESNKAEAAAAAKRKGSFKKWLRSSHRKFTSNSKSRSGLKDNLKTNGVQKFSNSELDNLKIKVISSLLLEKNKSLVI